MTTTTDNNLFHFNKRYVLFSLQPLNRTYYVSRDGREDIQFRLTVPFGCFYVQPNDPEPIACKHTIVLTTPEYLKCSQGIYTLDMCGKLVSSKEWNQTQSLSVQHKNNVNYATISRFQVHMKSKVRTNGEPFWDGVEIPTIYVSFIYTNIVIRDKILCS